MISSGPRALGGYSLSLLSNSNPAQPVVDVSPQASQLSGAKRWRPYSLSPSIPKRRNTSSALLISASNSSVPLDSSHPPLVSCSETMEVDHPHSNFQYPCGGIEDAVSSPSAPFGSPTITARDECTPLPYADPIGQQHLPASNFAPAPQILSHYSPLVNMGPLSWHPVDYDIMASSGPRFVSTGARPTIASLVDPRKRFRGRSLLSRQPGSKSDQGGGSPPPPPPPSPRVLPCEDVTPAGVPSLCNDLDVDRIYHPSIFTNRGRGNTRQEGSPCLTISSVASDVVL
jgi:hypothetical protein